MKTNEEFTNEELTSNQDVQEVIGTEAEVNEDIQLSGVQTQEELITEDITSNPDVQGRSDTEIEVNEDIQLSDVQTQTEQPEMDIPTSTHSESIINPQEEPILVQGRGNQYKTEKRKSVFPKLLKYAGLGVLVFGIAFAGSYTGRSISEPTNSTQILQVESSEEIATDISQVVDSASDSVVAITTETVVNGNFMSQYVSEGAGSGVIISSDGYIITNNHVIEDATQIRVTLANNETYDATLVGRDASVDIAVIKIEATDLTAAVLGDSESINVGESVVAIGNPLGTLGGTVTEGIISADERVLTIEGQEMTLLQTSAAINPGNSGGGLFNARGELIGVVVAKSSGEDVEGLGFAVPIDIAGSVAQEIIATQGNVSTNATYVLGVSMLDLTTPEAMAEYEVETPGIYVYEVSPNSDAEQIGLRSGDLLVEINGEKITSTEKAQEVVQATQNGDVLRVVIERDGRQLEASLEVQY